MVTVGKSSAVRSPRMERTVLRIALALVSVAAIAGCTASPVPTNPVPTWPVPPEQLPAPTSGSAEANVTCGSRTFAATGLTAPTGAEKESTPFERR